MTTPMVRASTVFTAFCSEIDLGITHTMLGYLLGPELHFHFCFLLKALVFARFPPFSAVFRLKCSFSAVKI
jgi:hypothetical protein